MINPEKTEEKFSAEATVNNITFSCIWDDDYNSYVLSVSKLSKSSVLEISDNPEVARKAFEYAKDLAVNSINYLAFRAEFERYIHNLYSVNKI